MLGGIDGQIIVNKQKWAGQKLQPFLTMERIALSWKKRKKSKGLKLNEYGNKSVECGGVPISFFIVARITIITDKKLAAEV